MLFFGCSVPCDLFMCVIVSFVGYRSESDVCTRSWFFFVWCRWVVWDDLWNSYIFLWFLFLPKFHIIEKKKTTMRNDSLFILLSWESLRVWVRHWRIACIIRATINHLRIQWLINSMAFFHIVSLKIFVQIDISISLWLRMNGKIFIEKQ